MSVLVLLTIIHLSTSPSSTFSIWQQHKTATSKWTFCLNKKIDVWQVFICFLAHQQSGYIITHATRPLPMENVFTKREGSRILLTLISRTCRRNYGDPQRAPKLPTKAEGGPPCRLPVLLGRPCSTSHLAKNYKVGLFSLLHSVQQILT